MEYVFEYTKQDYLDAQALKRANERQPLWMLHLLLLLGAGCVVYLNLSTLRGTLTRDDTAAWWAAAVACLALLLNYSPRLSAVISLALGKGKTGDAGEITGPRRVAVRENYLEFDSGGVCRRSGYQSLVRVNYNERTILFYLQNGAVEAVPTRIFKGNAAGKNRFLARISELANKADSGQGAELGDGFGQYEHQVLYRIGLADFRHCNCFHIKRTRAREWSRPGKCIWLLLLLVAAAGSLKGLYLWSAGFRFPMGFLKLFYLAELAVWPVGLLMWYRPCRLVNFAMEQSFRAGRYPAGFWDERVFSWDGEHMAYRYGSTAAALEWAALTVVWEDEEYLYFYQGNVLVLFVPKAVLGGAVKGLAAAVRGKGGRYICTQ